MVSLSSFVTLASLLLLPNITYSFVILPQQQSLSSSSLVIVHSSFDINDALREGGKKVTVVGREDEWLSGLGKDTDLPGLSGLGKDTTDQVAQNTIQILEESNDNLASSVKKEIEEAIEEKKQKRKQEREMKKDQIFDPNALWTPHSSQF